MTLKNAKNRQKVYFSPVAWPKGFLFTGATRQFFHFRIGRPIARRPTLAEYAKAVQRPRKNGLTEGGVEKKSQKSTLNRS